MGYGVVALTIYLSPNIPVSSAVHISILQVPGITYTGAVTPQNDLSVGLVIGHLSWQGDKPSRSFYLK